MKEAIKCGNVNIIRALLEVGANLVSGLIPAAEHDELEIIKELLRAGAGIHYCDDTGRTALGTAVMNGDEKIVRVLLDDSADPSKFTINGLGTIEYAVTNGLGEMLKPLRSSQPDITSPPKSEQKMIDEYDDLPTYI